MSNARGIGLLLLLLVASGCAGNASSEVPAQAAQPIATPQPGEVERPPYVARDTEPRLINGEEIQRMLTKEFPEELRHAGISGSVDKFVFVDASGNVTEVRSFGPEQHIEFGQAAERVVRSMKFRPAEYDGEPVGVWIIQKIDFTTR